MSLLDDIGGLLERVRDDAVNKIGLLTVVLALGLAALQYLVSGDYSNGLVSTVIAVGSIVVLRYGIAGTRAARVAEQKSFGVSPPAGDKVWRREEIAHELIARIEATKNATFITGRSGSGKSTLLRETVSALLTEKKWSIVRISDYDNLAQRLSAELRIPQTALMRRDFTPAEISKDGRRLLIIFDQLERIAAAPPDLQDWEIHCARNRQRRRSCRRDRETGVRLRRAPDRRGAAVAVLSVRSARH